MKFAEEMKACILIHHDALRVQAGPAVWVEIDRSGIVIKLGKPLARPVLLLESSGKTPHDLGLARASPSGLRTSRNILDAELGNLLHPISQRSENDMSLIDRVASEHHGFVGGVK